MAFPLREGSDQAPLEEETDSEEERDEDQGEKHGVPFRRHKEDIAKEAAEHEKFTMGEVKNIGDPKDQRKTESSQGIDASLKGPNDEKLNNERCHILKESM